MNAKAFADTNVVIYATFGEDAPDKSEVAVRTLRLTSVISAQVLNEFVNVARGKLGRTWPEVKAALDAIDALEFQIAPLTEATHVLALDIARDHGLRIFDACIVAAAIEAGCDTLWSEDLQHGRQFGRLTIRNPFLAP